MADEKAELERLCASAGITRFAPDELLELLEDGEEVDWIVEQVLPDADAAARTEASAVLARVAAAVAPDRQPDSEPIESAASAEEGPDVQDGGVGVPDFSDLSQVQLPPGIDPAQVQQLMQSPQGELLADFGAFCQDRGVELNATDDGTQELLRTLHEEWLDTPRESLDGRRPADVLEGGRLLPQKVETFRREAPKVGRNDPCPCGSGRKYKKCCGRGG